MNDSEKLQLADAAITHVLRRIHESSEVGYYMGHGTESFAGLCAAYAAFHDQDRALVREIFEPVFARDPRHDLEKRIDDLEEQLEEKPRSGCCEDVPTYGPQNLTAEDFIEQVRTLLQTQSQNPAAFVAEITAMFEVNEVPYHCLARR